MKNPNLPVVILLMVQKSCDHQLRLAVDPTVDGSYIIV